MGTQGLLMPGLPGPALGWGQCEQPHPPWRQGRALYSLWKVRVVQRGLQDTSRED